MFMHFILLGLDLQEYTQINQRKGSLGIALIGDWPFSRGHIRVGKSNQAIGNL